MGNANPSCPVCGHKIIWQNDFDYDGEDYGNYGEEGIVSIFSCTHCGAEIECYVPINNDKGKE